MATRNERDSAAPDTTWYREARLGMFIHWGLYSQAAGMWKGHRHYGVVEYMQQNLRIPKNEYAKLAEEFNPEQFDAKAWVEVARQAGFKYIVITAKHHEGFAMYDSKADDFNIVRTTRFGRDPIKELAQAARAAGIRLGFYYSQYLDWRDPDAAGNDWDFPVGPRDFRAYMHRKAIPQLTELLTQYGPIGVIWFDIPGASTPDESAEWVKLVRSLQPDTLISSRVGNGLGDFENYGDNELPPAGSRTKPWESIFTHNHSWGFVRHDRTFKSPTELIRTVATVASRGGNTLINVGPEPTGKLPEVTVRAFREMGSWVHANAESIYGTQGGTLGPMPWGVITQRDRRVYLHVFHPPRNRQLIVPAMAELRPSAVQLLAGGAQLPWQLRSADLWITLPETLPDARNTVIAVDVACVPAEPRPAVLILSREYDSLSLDVCTAELGPGLSIKRHSGWGYFGHTNYFSSFAGMTSARSSVAWTIRVLEPGSYWVSIDYAANRSQGGREAVIEFAGQELFFEVLETGESDPYRITPIYRHELGIVDIASDGTYRLQLRPTETVRGAYRRATRPVDNDEELFTFKMLRLSPIR
ncbi:MAG TPA: alpha-L-fucosidase [Steroidobacter sp.]